MEELKLVLNDSRGAFNIYDDGEQLGTMEIGISGNNLTVYHTEVLPKAEGLGYAKKLFNAMTTYARENNLKVTPICTYVLAQFRRHPDDYKDIWHKQALN